MIVIKIGGAEGIGPRHACEDIAALGAAGQPVVVVHGGSHETNQLSERLGIEPRFITSPSGHTSRYTDEAAIDVFQMACRRLNARIVRMLREMGVDAVGLSGIDGGLWAARRKDAIRAIENGVTTVIRDDHSGTIERVDSAMLEALLRLGKTPVLCPPAIGRECEPLNVDADRAAAMTAASLRADSLVILSNVPGLLRAFPDESSLIPSLSRGELQSAIELAQGRMKRKVIAAGEAIDAGVSRVILADARRERPITHALQGQGTCVT
ncbi:acetylglutamate kinase [Leptolyngbya valderiana BDU 20041]|nr:acetylglutamate kinase [Leptolyngbya valderiana BDU 20041]